MPLSTFVVSKKLEETRSDRGFLFYTTHINDPLPAVVGLESLEIVDWEGLVEFSRLAGTKLKAGLEIFRDRWLYWWRPRMRTDVWSWDCGWSHYHITRYMTWRCPWEENVRLQPFSQFVNNDIIWCISNYNPYYNYGRRAEDGFGCCRGSIEKQHRYNTFVNYKTDKLGLRY